MKKTYIAPSINVVTVNNTIMAGSFRTDDTPVDDLGSARGRYNNVQWLDDEDDEAWN